MLTPTALAERAQALPGVTVEVLDRAGLEAAGMGAFAAVARGSDEEPRLITIRYEPPDVAGPLLGFVGKAVTFDSGGISIKPAAKMHEMKFDMSGGAAVVESVGAIAALGLPVRVAGIVGATENMPSGHSVKPGDIVRAKTGVTIEVNNTDAEGRMVLADCLAHAIDIGAERLVDLATLTGAMVVALGSTYAGLYSNDDDWAGEIVAAGDRTGEIVWRMPLHAEYAKAIEGRYGDIVNSPADRGAGSATAAEFLKRFVGDVPWAHLDIAGTAYDLGRPYALQGRRGLGRPAAGRARARGAGGAGSALRLVGLWILLVAVYAATLGIPAETGSDYAGNEPHHLLAAESIVSDRDVDLADEYAERSYAGWYPRELQTDGQIVGGRLVEPHGAGFALLIAPAYAIGGARAVQGEMLALLALAFVLGAALARRMVPEPWATAGAALVGLSPPALAAATTITPGVPAAVLLAGAALCALAVRERPRLRYVFGGALLLARAAVAGLDVRGAGRGRRLGAGRLDAARAAPDGGADRGRGAGRLARLLRDDQRPLLRRDHAARGRHRGAARRARLHRAGARGSRGCGWTARRACCAGRRCSRSCSSPAGCSTARAATSSRASRRRGARPRRARRCCWAWSARTWSWWRCSPAAACAERCSRACRWWRCCRRSPRLTAWGLRHVPRVLAAALTLVTLGRERVAVRAGSSRSAAGVARARLGRAVGAVGGGVPGLHGRGVVPGAGVRGDRLRRGRVVVARAAGRGRVAAGGCGLADLARPALSRRTAPVREVGETRARRE